MEARAEGSDAELELPPHLGGHQGKTHTDPGVLRFLRNAFNASSLLDIGCGPGGTVEMAREMGFTATGIDGDWTVNPDIVHDYTTFPSGQREICDVAWSVEFLEHIEEKYLENVMPDFQRCKLAVVTHAPPGHDGHHHVNCRDANYWIETFAAHGFLLDFDLTMTIRRASTMKKPFMQLNGLFFWNNGN